VISRGDDAGLVFQRRFDHVEPDRCASASRGKATLTPISGC
jgi:hypothetical protein